MQTSVGVNVVPAIPTVGKHAVLVGLSAADAGLALVRSNQRSSTFVPTVARPAGVGGPVQAQHPTPEANLNPAEQIKAWTRDLFSETAVPVKASRITSDGSYSRQAV